MKHRLFITLAATTMLQTTLQADGDQISPELVAALPTEQLIAANEILRQSDATATKFKGMYFTSKPEDISSKGRPSVTGVQFDNFIYSEDEEDIQGVIEPFFGKPLTPQLLVDMKQALGNYFKQAHPAARIVYPEQNAVNGVVQVVISPMILGEVRYKGNYWYSDAYLSRYLHITPGKEIAEDALLNDFSWTNRNPFQRLSVAYIPSKVPGVMDLEITTQDRMPVRFYARSDNTGNESTGVVRFATGFSWGNAFGIGDLFTYEYGTSSLKKRVILNRINYTSFLPWRHVLTINSNFNVTKPRVIQATSRTVNYGARLRYTIPFKPLFIPLAQDITFGGDWKYYYGRTISKRTGIPRYKRLNETILNFSYTISDTIENHNFSLSFENYWSPGGFLKHSSKKNYNLFRPFSKNHFDYFILTGTYTYYLPYNFVIAAVARVQRANRTLPSSELFSNGGYSTVRGYRPSAVSTDNGFTGNLELRMPPITFFRKMNDRLVFLAFADYGKGTDFKVSKPSTPTSPKNHKNQHLASTGFGLRYNFNPYIAFRADYGFKLHKLYTTTPLEKKNTRSLGRWHLGLLVSY